MKVVNINKVFFCAELIVSRKEIWEIDEILTPTGN
jgi:hypothetical protein